MTTVSSTATVATASAETADWAEASSLEPSANGAASSTTMNATEATRPRPPSRRITFESVRAALFRTDLPDVPRERPQKVPSRSTRRAPRGRRQVLRRRVERSVVRGTLVQTMEVDDRTEVEGVVVDGAKHPSVGPCLAVDVHDFRLASVAECVRPVKPGFDASVVVQVVVVARPSRRAHRPRRRAVVRVLAGS